MSPPTSSDASPKKRSRWRRWWLPALALLLSASLGLWLLQRQFPRATEAPPAPEVEGTPATPQAPRPGGIYSEALIGRPGRWNPLFEAFNPVDRDVNRLVYCRLITFDARGFPQGDLAVAWGISADASVYNIALRQDMRWHDGRPVTAEDVAFTVELMRSRQLPVPEAVRELWSQVEVLVLDPYTLQFRLPTPFAPFLDYLSFGILPKHIWEEIPLNQLPDHPRNLEPVGCGPYQFDHLLIEDGQLRGVVLRAYEDYYQGRSYIDEIVFRYYPDASSALEAYQAGEVLGLSEVTLDILPQALALPELNFYTARRPRLTLIYLNLDNPEAPFFTFNEVRRALLMTLDRQRLIQRHLQGQGIVAQGPIFPDSWAYNPELPPIPYDPEEAARLMRAAEFTRGKDGLWAQEDQPVRFTLLYPDAPPYPGLAQDIANAWRRFGFDVVLEAAPFEEVVQRLEAREYHAGLVELDFTRSPDPDPYPFWHESQAYEGQNYSNWIHRRASLFLERARVTPDITKRQSYYQNFQLLFVQELPALPLFYPVYTYAVDQQVQGIRLGPIYDTSDRFQNILEWYMLQP